MNSKQLKYVILLADLGSFSSAAEELGISQPSLSQYIKKTEKEIGMALFERVNNDVRLTDAGRAYVEYGKRILNLKHQLECRISDIANNKTGSVIVGTSPYRSAAMMPEIAKRFQVKYPGIYLVIEEMISSDLIAKAERGSFDLCLTMLPVDEKVFAYEKITEEEMVLAVPANYPEIKSFKSSHRKYSTVDLREIDGSGFVMVTDVQVMQRALNRLCDEYGIALKTAAIVKSLEAQINMVRNGVGMAIVPTGIERFCNQDEVRFYSFAQDLPRREVVAVWRKDREPSQVVGDLISVIKHIEW